MAVILYHKINKHTFCNDGFAAALCAYAVFGDEANYIPVVHGDPPVDMELLRGQDVFILDFVYDLETMREIAGLAKSTYVIDHHKSTQDQFAGKFEDGSVHFIYSDVHSAAGIAFNFFQSRMPLFLTQPSALPLLIEHVEDNDLWRHSNPYTKPFIRALQLLPTTFNAWWTVLTQCRVKDSPTYQRMVSEGILLDGYAENYLNALVESSFSVNLNGHKGLAVNFNGSSLDLSILGEKLAERSGTFGAVFNVQPNKTQVELRAKNMDVAALASLYGGGGHVEAAGFRIETAQVAAFVDAAKSLDIARLAVRIQRYISKSGCMCTREVEMAIEQALDTDAAQDQFSYALSVSSDENWFRQFQFYLARMIGLPKYLSGGLLTRIFPYYQDDNLEKVIEAAGKSSADELLARLIAALSVKTYKLRNYRCTVNLDIAGDQYSHSMSLSVRDNYVFITRK